MFAAALRRRRLRGLAAWRPTPFEPFLAPASSTIRSAGHRSLGPTMLARPPLASLPFALPLRRRRFDGGGLRRVEIDVRLLGEFHAQLVAQHPRAHFHDLALREVAEFERAERDADQAVDRKAQVLEDFLDLSVFSLSQAQSEPGVRALLAVELGLDAEVVDAVDGDAFAQPIERHLFNRPMRASPVSAQPAGRRQLQRAREAAVVGEQEQPFGVDIKPADCDKTWQVWRQHCKNRLPPLRITRRSDEPSGLMEQKEARGLRRG